MNNYRRGVSKRVATTSSDEPMNILSFGETLKLKISLLDYRILIVMTLLILIGIVMVFSSTMYLIAPGDTTSDPFGFLIRQFTAIIGGYIGIVLMALFPFKLFENINLLNIGMIVVVILLVVTYFIDAGNIWTIKDYEGQPGGVFKFDEFYKQIAVAYGLGLRVNLGFLLVRLDAGMKAYDPADKDGRFVLFKPNFSDKFALHFAIGYPF